MDKLHALLWICVQVHLIDEYCLNAKPNYKMKYS